MKFVSAAWDTQIVYANMQYALCFKEFERHRIGKGLNRWSELGWGRWESVEVGYQNWENDDVNFGMVLVE